MKVIFAVFSVIFLFSCNSPKETGSNKDADSSDTDIGQTEDDSDTDNIEPACLNDWEEMEIIEDISELFDFEIIKKTDKWSWKREGDFEKMDSPADCSPQHVMEDGAIISTCLGANTSDGIEYMNILKKDGVVERFFIKPEKIMKFEFMKGYYVPFLNNTYFDDSKNEIITLFSMKSNESGNPVKSFMQKMTLDGNSSYFSWKMKDNTVCSMESRRGDTAVFLCQNWKDDSSIRNPEILTFLNGRMYKKLFNSDISRIPASSGFNGSEFFAYYSYQGSGTTYSFDVEDFCVQESDQYEHFLTDYFQIKSEFKPYFFSRHNSESIFGGYTRNQFEDETTTWWTLGVSLYINSGESEKIYSVVNKEKPEDFIHAAVPGVMAYKDNGILFYTGGSDFDVEDLARFEYSKEEAENGTYPFQPFLMALDMNSDKVYVKQILSDSRNNFPGAVFIIGEDLYYQEMKIEESSNVINTLFRIPVSWIINEESLAKEKYLIVEEKKTLDSIGKVLSVSCGSSYACALNEKNQPMCWGDNSTGQLGDLVGEIDKEDATKRTNPNPDIIEMNEVLSGKKVVLIKSGFKHACAITDDRVLYCWGDNGFENVGTETPGSTFTYYPLPVKTDGVLKDKKISDVAPGLSHTCAIDEEGKGYCWGQNLLGSAGCGLEDQIIHEPIEVDMTGVLKDRKMVEISSGSGHTCVVADDGGIYCWGSNDRGQLGDGNGGTQGGIYELGDFSRVPVKTETGEEKFTSVAAGSSYTCILSDKGKVFCFGSNSKGQLGDGTIEMRLVPVEVKSDKVFKSVSTGFEHSCAVDETGAVYCWGSNIVGQLGNGTKENSLVPVKVKYKSQTKVKSVSCGHRHTCSLDETGKVFCWGWNSDGQLGNGTYEDSLTPTEIKVKE